MKTLFNNLDKFTKRILAIALSITIVCCSLSLLFFSIQTVQATPTNNTPIKNTTPTTVQNTDYPKAIASYNYLYILSGHSYSLGYTVYKDGEQKGFIRIQ